MSVDRHDALVTGTGNHGGPDPRREVVAAERFAARGVAAWVGVVAAGLGFAALTTLVRTRWQPMQTADQAITDELVAVVADHPLLHQIVVGITDLGRTSTLVLVLAVGTVWLLLRRLPKLAVYVVLTGAGGLILNAVVKELVARLRPVVSDPVYSTDGWSFPSGHAMSSLVCYGVVVVVFAPVLRTRARRTVITVAALIVASVGVSRVALGVHYPSDVLAGWLLATLWLVLCTLAFQRWRTDAGTDATGPLPGDVPPAEADDLRPVPERHEPAPAHPWRGIGQLGVAWVLLAGLLAGLGMLVRTLASETSVLGWDHGVVAVLAEHRNTALTAVLDVFGEVGNTLAVVTAAVIVAALALAVFRSRRPVVFLAVALLGEITLFLTTAAVVDRDRPRVAHLNPDLPPTASFPSGHVAASLTLYASTAALVWAATRRLRYRLPAAALLLVPVLVAAQRLYAGAHHPTDIVGSVLLACVWTAVAWWVVRPVSDTDTGAGADDAGGSVARVRSPDHPMAS